MTINKEPWHIDKRLSIGHLLSTISLICVLAGFIHKMDTRLAVTEARLEIVEKQLQDSKEQFTKQLERLTLSIDARLNRIDNKLDKLITKDR
ncbi:MAG: hypothetical protein KGV56_03120 [Gammaproteobacteria bacterium]|nr:hypothetical protein [Gammaproteobacteria bacterium]